MTLVFSSQAVACIVYVAYWHRQQLIYLYDNLLFTTASTHGVPPTNLAAMTRICVERLEPASS